LKNKRKIKFKKRAISKKSLILKIKEVNENGELKKLRKMRKWNSIKRF